MANLLTGLIATIYASLNIVSRELVGFIPAVYTNADAERAALNQAITYPVAPAAGAIDTTAAVNAPDAGDQNIGNGSITITKSRGVPIRWNGEQTKSGMNSGWYEKLLQDQFAEAFRTLTNEIEGDLGVLYRKSSRAYGTAGTTPFATADNLSDFAQPGKILDDNGAGGNRQMILGTTAAANIGGKQAGLFRVNESGTDGLLRQGSIGRVEGFDVGKTAQIQSHTKGTGTGFLVNNAAGYAEGDTVIAADTGTGTILAGDIVTATGDSNKYVVASALAGGSFTIAAPGLLQPLADNTAITVGGSYTANMAFSRSAIHLVTRAPAMPVDLNGNAMDMADDVIYVTDDVSGLVFEVALYRQYRQLLYMVSIAWGATVAKPEHTVLLLG